MNIIHSSSLAYTPAARQKPRTDAIAAKSAGVAGSVNNTHTLIPVNTPELRPSEPNHIQNILNENGLSNANLNNQSGNSRAQKAVSAYTENNKLAAQLKIAESVHGIDLYV